MLTVGSLIFASPWVLLALLLLPAIWLLLRSLPPPARLQHFPPVMLLLGERDKETTRSTVPLWLRILRLALVFAIITAFAGPSWTPDIRNPAQTGERPLAILLDGSWASSQDWQERTRKAGEILDRARVTGTPASVSVLTALPGQPPAFQDAALAKLQLVSLEPNPWLADYGQAMEWVERDFPEEFDTIWISDGLESQGRTALYELLSQRGEVMVFEGGGDVLALRPPQLADGILVVPVAGTGRGDAEVAIDAVGPDPAGSETVLGTSSVSLAAGESGGVAEFRMPAELSNRVRRFEIRGVDTAGAVSVAGDSILRREIAIYEGRRTAEGPNLLSPAHYIRRALQPFADLVEGPLNDIMLADPDVLVLADVPSLPEVETRDVLDWVTDGGLLVRFAGPRIAASGISRDVKDPLYPVRLRAGSRSFGGAVSWEKEKGLQEFAEVSPFFGLEIPDEVSVRTQVLAQSDSDLSKRVLAALEDGTPLVTAEQIGSGNIVFFHVSANAEWSNLPLSRLFLGMLERLVLSSRSGLGKLPEDAEFRSWKAVSAVSSNGSIVAVDAISEVPGRLIVEGLASPDLPPGLYESSGSRAAINAVGSELPLRTQSWPAGVLKIGFSVAAGMDLKGYLLVLAMALLMLDMLATLTLRGRVIRTGNAFAALGATVVFSLFADQSGAETSAEMALSAASNTTFAYVITGDRETDLMSVAGLRGLSAALEIRTTVEPSPPAAVDPNTDELAVYPFIYWPITVGQEPLTEEGSLNVNRYLRSGGMILFDTRDAAIGGFRFRTRPSEKLQQLTRNLDLPALEPLPEGHVLSRTFYLIKQFPGRYQGGVWVEARTEGDESGSLFKVAGADQGVSPVVIGGNDWASAWAIDENWRFLVNIGEAGQRQREAAFRFGINLVMYALTGNYKSDQAHIEVLLDRLSH